MDRDASKHPCSNGIPRILCCCRQENHISSQAFVYYIELPCCVCWHRLCVHINRCLWYNMDLMSCHMFHCLKRLQDGQGGLQVHLYCRVNPIAYYKTISHFHCIKYIFGDPSNDLWAPYTVELAFQLALLAWCSSQIVFKPLCFPLGPSMVSLKQVFI